MPDMRVFGELGLVIASPVLQPQEILQPQRSRELFEQSLCILQIGAVEALGEPALGRGGEIAGLAGPFQQLGPASEACRGAKLRRLCVLGMGNLNGLPVSAFGFAGIRCH